MSELYNLVFSGEVDDAFSKQSVRENLHLKLKVSHAHLDKMFSGKPVVIKKGVPKESAELLGLKLKKLGAITQIQQVSNLAASHHGSSQHAPAQHASSQHSHSQRSPSHKPQSQEKSAASAAKPETHASLDSKQDRKPQRVAETELSLVEKESSGPVYTESAFSEVALVSQESVTQTLPAQYPQDSNINTNANNSAKNSAVTVSDAVPATVTTHAVTVNDQAGTPQVIVYNNTLTSAPDTSVRSNPVLGFLSVVSGLFWLSLGLVLMLIFSPFPEIAIKRGFIIGSFFVLFGGYRMWKRGRG